MDKLMVFKQILMSVSSRDIEKIIELLENNKEISWHPVGGFDNNEGTIDSAIDPADAIFERITNAVDAMIELGIEKKKLKQLPKTPREAVEDVLNVVMDDYVKLDPQKQRDIAKNIQLIIEQSNDPKSPTIVVMDKGIGQLSSKFKDTFLSLHGNNKIDKFYLMGQYGQGGSASFAFAKYTILISKRYNQNKIGFTIVRCKDPGSNYKRYTYQYMTDKNGDILYITKENMRNINNISIPVDFWDVLNNNGTIVKMINYNITKYSSKKFDTWYYLCRNALFDTIHPFLLYDKRPIEISKTKDTYIRRTRVIYGTRYAIESPKAGIKTRYKKELIVPVTNKQDSYCVVRYWVFNKEITSSNYLDLSDSPVVFTLNGQRQHKEKRSFIYDFLNLKILQKHLLIQIDCDNLKSKHRKDFFSTIRSLVKETDLKQIIYRKIKDTLSKDSEIIKIMDEIVKKAISQTSGTKRKEDKQKVSNLLKQWNTVPKEGIHNGGDFFDSNGGEDGISSIESQLHDIPTYIKCINKRNPVLAQKGKSFILIFQTDAKDNYFVRRKKRGRFNVMKVPNCFQIQSYETKMKNGVFRVYVKELNKSKIGEKHILSFKLTRPNMSDLTVDVEVIIIKPIIKTKSSRSTSSNNKKVKPISLPIEIIRLKNDKQINNLDETIKKRISKTPAVVEEIKGNLCVYINLMYPEYLSKIKNINLGPSALEKRVDEYVRYLAAHAVAQFITFDEMFKNNNSSSEHKIEVDVRLELMKKEIKRICSTILTLIFK